jgi:hypothetical protein
MSNFLRLRDTIPSNFYITKIPIPSITVTIYFSTFTGTSWHFCLPGPIKYQVFKSIRVSIYLEEESN